MAPRFGVWAPVYGNHGARYHPDDPPDAGYRRNRDLLVRAERAGYDSTLLAQHVMHPSNVEDGALETWSTLAALAETTSRIELIGAIKPLLINPLVFAKVAANIADISERRLSVNVVSGWFLPELEALGLEVVEHDDRYAYSREWLEHVLDLWAGKETRIGGGHPAILRPVPAEAPQVYVGGESEPARALAARHADVFFINGRPLSDTVHVIEDLRARPRDGDPLRFALSAFVIARPTEDEAAAELAYLQSLVDAERRPEISTGTDPKTQMYQVLSGTSRVGSNGGTLAGLVGSYEQVVERIEAFHDAGIDLFMLQFQPLEAELDRFADNIIPHFR
jgi:alkanesulfonate monooxygenase